MSNVVLTNQKVRISKKKKRKLRVNKAVVKRNLVILSVFILGLVVANNNGWFSSKQDCLNTADKMATYIVADYEQNNDLGKAIKVSKELNDSGLRVAVEDYDWSDTAIIKFLKDNDMGSDLIKEIEIKKN